MNENGRTETALAGYASGSSDTSQINEAIAHAWDDILADDEARAEAASLLGVAAESLPSEAPFRAEPAEAGLGMVETAIVVFAVDLAKGVAYDLLKDSLKDASREGMLRLWRSLVRDRAEEGLPSDGLGRETPLPDDVQ